VGLMADLDGRMVGIDTAIFIYFIEEHPQFLPLIDPLFEAADAGSRELVTSALTLLEVLVVPYRAGNRVLADRYEALLTRSRGIRVIDLDRNQLRAAAQLRATTGCRWLQRSRLEPKRFSRTIADFRSSLACESFNSNRMRRKAELHIRHNKTKKIRILNQSLPTQITDRSMRSVDRFSPLFGRGWRRRRGRRKRGSWPSPSRPADPLAARRRAAR
jgi:hypothetical protein